MWASNVNAKPAAGSAAIRENIESFGARSLASCKYTAPGLLPEGSAPELLYLQTKWASLMSYRLTVDILADVLPMQTNTRSVALNTQKIAEKMEEEPEDEQVMFTHYIEVNQNSIPNYGERYRYGETITTAFIESTIYWVVSKRMVKKQQMRWTKRGAHLLLQTRTKTLNGELRDTFCSWHPNMTQTVENLPLAD